MKPLAEHASLGLIRPGLISSSIVMIDEYGNQTTELQGAHLSFLMDLASFICNIKYNEFDSN
jgi:hypothetical protein